MAGLLALAILLAVLPPYSDDGHILQNQSRVCFGSECFTVELALTPEQQSRGLMGRESLGPDKGMLFVFQEEGPHPFWMKNTLIPLDMVWMDSQGIVVFLAQDVQPCKADPCPAVNPSRNARYVLEVNGGTAERIGLEEGERAIIGLG
jgi:uncharacterized membrane protein (UPF0127 family)